ncbi:MAG: hypothetical protein QOI07_2615 [Verrucomicrobiota bacterium]
MGVVGTADGIKRVTQFVERLKTPVYPLKPRRNRPVFPGFEAVFGIPWDPQPYLTAELDAADLHRRAHLEDKHQRVYETATLYADAILNEKREGDDVVDLWLVAVPDFVWQNCRPRSIIATDFRVPTKGAIGESEARRRKSEPVLQFAEWRGDDTAYQFDPDFHNQLKGRLLSNEIPTQVVRESTVAFRDFRRSNGKLQWDLSVLESQIAWNLSSAVFYKTGGRPWKLGAARKGVCYLGVVFKQLGREKDPETACCAAQMFLDSGDGVVFKGDIGPWYNPKRGDFHLSRDAAEQLVGIAVDSYCKSHGEPPKEMFIHGRTWFGDDEWEGFKAAGGPSTNVVGVRIVPERALKVYHPSNNPVLRGSAFFQDDRKGLLWTKGWTPRLQTYPGLEVPLPMRIDITRGEAPIHQVFSDVLALTKLNYNACRFSDGIPVTLRFADAVGEILTSGPKGPVAPMAFRYYI